MLVELLVGGSYAPGCYRLRPVNRRTRRKLKEEIGESTALIQVDWDFPALARALGWDMRKVKTLSGNTCDHDGTDGTVMCKRCLLQPGDFINAARAWLDERDGHVFRVVDCPYF